MSTVGKTYPLWIIPLWKIISCLHVVQHAWSTAQDTLLQYDQMWKKKGESDAVKVVEEVFNALCTLSTLT